MKGSRFVFRMWYYFRVGYTTYLSFLLGFATTFVTVYYLAITNIPALQAVFPHFGFFAVVAFLRKRECLVRRRGERLKIWRRSLKSS